MVFGPPPVPTHPVSDDPVLAAQQARQVEELRKLAEHQREQTRITEHFINVLQSGNMGPSHPGQPDRESLSMGGVPLHG